MFLLDLFAQASSKKRTMPIYGFGTSTRDNRRKVFVSQAHNKDLFGVQSPVCRPPSSPIPPSRHTI